MLLLVLRLLLLCKAVVAMAQQRWESKVEERCFGVVGGDTEAHLGGLC